MGSGQKVREREGSVRPEVRGQYPVGEREHAVTQSGTAQVSVVPGESALRLWEAVRLSQIGSWVVDVDRHVVLISPEAFRLHGLEPPIGSDGKPTAAEVDLDDWADRLTPASAGPRENALERLAQLGEPVDYEFEVRVGRSTRHILGHAEVAQRSGGRVTQIFGYITDVTEQRRTERRNRRTQRELTHQQQVLERIARGETLGETLDRICRYVERLLPGTRCTVLVLDRASGVLRHGACPTIDREYADLIDGLPVGEGMGACGTAAARGDIVIVEDIQADTLDGRLHRSSVRASTWDQSGPSRCARSAAR